MKKAKDKTGEYILQQIRRLRAKSFYPSAIDIEDGKSVNHGERELVRVAFEYCASDEHVKRVIDSAVIRSFGANGEDRCPGPSELWALCKEINPTPAVAVVINPNCPECSGLGVMFVFWKGTSGVARCPRGCPISARQFHEEKVSRSALGSWYEDEQRGAEERRRVFVARHGLKPPRVTDAQIANLRDQQNQNRTVR